MNNGDILRTETHDALVDGLTHVWEYILLKTEKVDDSKLHYLPQHQCPACGDIGIHTYPNSNKALNSGWMFYCPYCYIHYYIGYYRREKVNGKPTG